MSDHSENGWPVLTSGQLHWFTSAEGRFAAPNSDVAVVAGHLIARFDTEVEPIAGKILDDWSWAARKVRGSGTVISNHASATAWDLNATKHPRGVHGTFTAARTAAVRKILASITDNSGHHIFRWGNDFSTVIDSMHFEINATPAQVTQARARLEDDMPLTNADADLVVKRLFAHTVALGKSEAGEMSATGTTFKAGEEVDYDFLTRWGGAGIGRLHRVLTAHQAQIVALTHAVAALSAKLDPKE